MPIKQEWSTLKTAIGSAPETEGIYEFGIKNGNSVGIVYIGKGTGNRGIRSRIISHINGNGNHGVFKFIKSKKTVKVRWQECSFFGQTGKSMEQDALEEYEAKYGELPVCNQRRVRDQHTLWDYVVRLFK